MFRYDFLLIFLAATGRRVDRGAESWVLKLMDSICYMSHQASVNSQVLFDRGIV